MIEIVKKIEREINSQREKTEGEREREKRWQRWSWIHYFRPFYNFLNL